MSHNQPEKPDGVERMLNTRTARQLPLLFPEYNNFTSLIPGVKSTYRKGPVFPQAGSTLWGTADALQRSGVSPTTSALVKLFRDEVAWPLKHTQNTDARVPGLTTETTQLGSTFAQGQLNPANWLRHLLRNKAPGS